MTNSTIAEWHTSDLVEPCLQRVLLRREGKMIGETPTALFRGQLFHEAVAQCHGLNRWQRTDCESALVTAAGIVKARAAAENRPLTPSVVENQAPIMGEVLEILCSYSQRAAPLVHKVLGVEVPIRLTLEIPDANGEPQPVSFASHLDLLWRGKDGMLHVWDWKYRDEAPTFPFLSRNLQLGLYWLAVRRGSVKLGDGEFGWTELQEWPEVSWFHVPSLKPFGRKTTTKNPDGSETVYQNGDVRPIEKAILTPDFLPVHEDRLVRLLSERVRMAEAGFWPASPDPIGCFLCECQASCPSLTERSPS